MSYIRGQNLTILILAVIVLTLLTTLSFLKSGSRTALAQEGANKINNYEALQTLKNRGLNNVAVVEEGNISPQSDGSGIEVVPIAAFRNDGDSGNGWFNLFSGGYIENQSSDTVCFMAPVYPPNNATLTQFRFSLTDNSASSDLHVFLDRVRLATGDFDNLAGGALVGRNSPNAIEASGPVDPNFAVVSKAYAYYVDLCFDPDTSSAIRLYGARLFYTP